MEAICEALEREFKRIQYDIDAINHRLESELGSKFVHNLLGDLLLLCPYRDSSNVRSMNIVRIHNKLKHMEGKASQIAERFKIVEQLKAKLLLSSMFRKLHYSAEALNVAAASAGMETLNQDQLNVSIVQTVKPAPSNEDAVDFRNKENAEGIIESFDKLPESIRGRCKLNDVITAHERIVYFAIDHIVQQPALLKAVSNRYKKFMKNGKVASAFPTLTFDVKDLISNGVKLSGRTGLNTLLSMRALGLVALEHKTNATGGKSKDTLQLLVSSAVEQKLIEGIKLQGGIECT